MPDWRELVRRRLADHGLDSAREADIVDELAQHLEDRYQTLRSAGLDDTEARQRSLDELNGSELLAEELRRARSPATAPPIGLANAGGPWTGLQHDLKIALRNIRLKPAFSLMVTGMLALGIAGNAAIFSIFDALFLRPLPFAQPERLIDLDETAPQWNLKYVGVSNPDYFAWRKSNSSFDGMAVFAFSSFNLSEHGSAQRVLGATVAYDLLDVLGLQPALGRNFLPEEDRPKGAKVVLLGYNLWQRLFQGDRNVLGRVLRLDEVPYAIVGVLPQNAVFPSRAELWTPLQADPDPRSGRGWYLSGVGRLKPGVTAEQASADLLRVHKALIPAGMKVNEVTAPVLTPLRDKYLGDFRAVSQILLGGVGIVLLIACVNIAALMMVRGSSRAREIAIRTAMGASRPRIIRQLLTENVVLAAVGGSLGVLLGDVFLRGMVSLMPANNLPQWVRFTLDMRFAAFCIGITVAAALLFGLVPAWQASGVDARGSLQEATVRTTLSRGRQSALRALVVGEIGLALMLLISAALLVEAFRKVLRVDPGFQPENVISYRINLPEAKYRKPEPRIAFFEQLLERTRTVPGGKSVGAASEPPLGGHWGNFWEAEGNPPLGPNEQNPVVLQVVATPGYFDAIGMTFLAGRPFRDEEADLQFTRTAVVNETFAKHFWPGKSPIGKRIRYYGSSGKWIEVVGLVRDEKHYGLDQEMKPGVFLPLRGTPRNSMSIVLRGSIDPQMLIGPAREALRQLDPELPAYDVHTMRERLDQSLWARRAYSWLFAAFAVIALVLAAAGIYGVISYAVSQRTREIGIRMALGAQPLQVLRSVLRNGMIVVALGVALGLAGAMAAVRLLAALLFGVGSHDPVVYAVVALGVVLVGLLANFVPARRAASVDPLRALRFE